MYVDAEKEALDFNRLVATVEVGARNFAKDHDLDPLMVAQALLKVGLSEIAYNTEHPGQRASLEGLINDTTGCLKVIDAVGTLNSGTGQPVN